MTAIAPAPGAEARSTSCPYRGLLPFSVGDADYFFGRDADREIITANLIAARLTLLYAPSGVGKTSVLLAGVMHDLFELARDGAVGGRGPEYLPVVVRRWSGDALAAIDEAIGESAKRVLDAAPSEPPRDDHLVDRLRGWADATDATLLLVLDQFEEFLLYHGDSWGPGGAAREVADALSARDLPVNVLIGLREDALASLDRFKGRVPYLFDNYLRLEHLDVAAAREAILGPLDVWRKEHPGDPMWAEQGLVETLLDEVTTDRVALGRRGAGSVDRGGRGGVETPFLQLVLTRLWEEERAQGSQQLRVATLRRLGGAGDVIRTHLDQQMGRLDKGEQDVAAAVFHQLVTPSGTKVARSLEDLAAYTGIPKPEIEAVLQTLSQSDWRIVRAVREPGAERVGTYEVFHDVLAEAILDWRSRHEEQRRWARIMRRAIIALVAAGLVVGLALIFAAVVQNAKENAEDERDRAQQATMEARSQRFAAESQLDLAVDPQRALLTALDAVEARETAAAVRALRGALAHANMRKTFPGAEGEVRAIRVSLDGSRLAQLGADHRLRVWSLEGSVPMVRFPAAGAPESFDLSPVGKRVATAGADATVRVWSMGRRRRPLEQLRAPAPVSAVRWSPAGDRLLTFGDGWTRLWAVDRPRSRILKTFRASNAVWSHGGTMFASAGRDGRVRVRDADGRALGRLPGRGAVRRLAFSEDGARVVAVRRDGAVSIAGADSCAAVGDSVTSADVSADGRHVALGSRRRVRIVDLRPGLADCRLIELPNPSGVETVAVNLSDDGSILVVAGDDGGARVYDVRGHVLLTTLVAGWSSRARLVMREAEGGGQVLFTAGDDGMVRQWQIGTLPVATRWRDVRLRAAAIGAGGQLTGVTASGVIETDWRRRGRGREVARLTGGARLAALGPGSSAAAATRQDRLRVWRPNGLSRWIGGGRAGRGATSVAFSADGSALVTAYRDGSVRIWDATTGRLTRSLPPSARTTGRAHASFVRGGAAVAVADSGVRVHELSGTGVTTLVGIGEVANTEPPGVPAAAHGAQLAVAARNDYVQQWADVGSVTSAPLLHAGRPAGGLAYSPDGEILAVAGGDGVRLLDARSRTSLAKLATGSFQHVAFSPDGRWILAVSRRSGAQVFPCRPCGDLATLLRRATSLRRLVEVAAIGVPHERRPLRRPAVPPPGGTSPPFLRTGPESSSEAVGTSAPEPRPLEPITAPPNARARGGGGGAAPTMPQSDSEEGSLEPAPTPQPEPEIVAPATPTPGPEGED